MLWNLLIIASIGLGIGAVARFMIPGEHPRGMLPNMAFGIVGAVIGWLISWFFWPAGDNQLHMAAYLMSIAGALIVLWWYAVYARRNRA